MKKIKIVIALVVCIILISALASVSLAEKPSADLEKEQTKLQVYSPHGKITVTRGATIECNLDLIVTTTINHINIGFYMIIYLMV